VISRSRYFYLHPINVKRHYRKSGSSLRDAPPNDENQGGGGDDGCGNVAGACVNGRCNRRRQVWNPARLRRRDRVVKRSAPTDRSQRKYLCLLHEPRAALLRSRAGAPAADADTGRLRFEPAIIGQVDDPARTVVSHRNVPGKYSLIAYQKVVRAVHFGISIVRRRAPGINPP